MREEETIQVRLNRRDLEPPCGDYREPKSPTGAHAGRPNRGTSYLPEGSHLTTAEVFSKHFKYRS